MLDTRVAANNEKDELKRLGQQIEDMLLSLDYRD